MNVTKMNVVIFVISINELYYDLIYYMSFNTYLAAETPMDCSELYKNCLKNYARGEVSNNYNG